MQRFDLSSVFVQDEVGIFTPPSKSADIWFVFEYFEFMRVGDWLIGWYAFISNL